MDATVQTMLQYLGNNQVDLTEAANIYEDVLGDLASIPLLTNFASLTPNGSGIVALPSTARDLLYMSYGGLTMGELSIREANWIYPNWENTGGEPQAYVAESMPARTMQLVPNDASSTATAIYAETRNTLPAYLIMPVTLLIMSAEFRRESDHQNVNIADACSLLGHWLIDILMEGVKPYGKLPEPESSAR